MQLSVETGSVTTTAALLELVIGAMYREYPSHVAAYVFPKVLTVSSLIPGQVLYHIETVGYHKFRQVLSVLVLIYLKIFKLLVGVLELPARSQKSVRSKLDGHRLARHDIEFTIKTAKFPTNTYRANPGTDRNRR